LVSASVDVVEARASNQKTTVSKIFVIAVDVLAIRIIDWILYQ
jgi:hypothetical protein